MTQKYWTYRDHNDNSKIIFCGYFTSIAEADDAFQKKIGKHPAKMSYIGARTGDYDPTWGGAKTW